MENIITYLIVGAVIYLLGSYVIGVMYRPYQKIFLRPKEAKRIWQYHHNPNYTGMLTMPKEGFYVVPLVTIEKCLGENVWVEWIKSKSDNGCHLYDDVVTSRATLELMDTEPLKGVKLALALLPVLGCGFLYRPKWVNLNLHVLVEIRRSDKYITCYVHTVKQKGN